MNRAIKSLTTLEIIEVMENFLTRKRPPEHIRLQLDITYQIENQSVVIYEVRPQWNDPKIIRQHPIAKTTYVKSSNHWKVFWQRADLKWHSYSPKPVVKKLHDFARLVEEDLHHCFWG